jgi:hypothetical protein
MARLTWAGLSDGQLRAWPYPAIVSTPPVACTLRPRDFMNRLDAWQALSDGWLLAREPIPSGIRLIFARAPGVAESLEELVRLEAECCPWMHSQLQADDQRLVIDLTGGDPEAVKAVATLFGAGEP